MKHNDYCQCHKPTPYASKCMRCNKWLQDDRQRKQARVKEWAGCEGQRER
jgi:hypothetical protein